MKNNIEVKVIKKDGALLYKVRKNEFTVSNKFDKTFYSDSDEEYTRTYPRSMMFNHDENSIEMHYNRFINREYFEEKNQSKIDDALEWICDNHKKNDVKWWLAGSAALYIRGIDVIPHDIDVMTYMSEIDKIKEIVYDKIIEPFHFVTGWVVKGFGVIDYNCRIDYAFEPEKYVDDNGYCDFGLYAEQHLEKIVWHGREIQIPPIELHVLSNVRRGRQSIVDAINNYSRK